MNKNHIIIGIVSVVVLVLILIYTIGYIPRNTQNINTTSTISTLVMVNGVNLNIVSENQFYINNPSAYNAYISNSLSSTQNNSSSNAVYKLPPNSTSNNSKIKNPNAILLNRSLIPLYTKFNANINSSFTGVPNSTYNYSLSINLLNGYQVKNITTNGGFKIIKITPSIPTNAISAATIMFNITLRLPNKPYLGKLNLSVNESA